MGQNIRWAVAGLATAAAFVVPAWLCGAVVLPPLLKDPAVRWSLASALGAVLSSLTVLWGHGFATRATTPGPSPDRRVQATAERAVAIGGDNQGSISIGDGPGATTSPVPPAAGPQPAAGPNPTPTPDAGTGTVSASGNRSIAIGGNNSGPLSNGDQSAGGQPGGAHP
ncbi:hypothetical protein [Streptomyces sp. NPDC093109]|uniref:hypothetical protein n=1 Tax=Streptomyces sp. NPDC093109 TaxID=3154977 RepID=UPI00344CE067